MKWIDKIKSYIPYNEQEEKDKAMILYCIEKFDDILSRNNTLVHMTCSAFVLNKSRDMVLMVYHNIYDSWSWTGGHADGEEDFLAVAVREVKEETGVKTVIPILNDIFSLDVLPVLGHNKRNSYVSAHIHLTITYLLQADENERLEVKPDENSNVMWIPLEKVNQYSTEPHMKIIYDKLIKKLNCPIDKS